MWWPSGKMPTLKSVIVIAIALQSMQIVECANILGVFTHHSPSHLIVNMAVVKALAEKGHNITVVSILDLKVEHENIRTIVIPPTDEQERLFAEAVAEMASTKNNIFSFIKAISGSLGMLLDVQYEALKDERFTVLYEMADTKFDLVIMGYFLNDFQLGVAAKFNCPIIINWVSAPMGIINRFSGNPDGVSYVPAINVAIERGKGMGLIERAKTFFATVFLELVFRGLDYRIQNFYTELFGNDKNFPTLNEMRRNISLVLCNNHFSEGPIRPNVPAIVEIGGIQIKDKPDPLSKDVADLLDASQKHGAILFSLGSNIQGSHIKPELVTIIYKVLSSLEQNVIWKWENLDKTPGNSSNILYKKWLQQDDILAHPNLKLFITHAGKGSIVEAQYHAVPMLALPVFADQHGNAQKMVSYGYGLQLELLEITEESLNGAIIEVLNNESYARKLQQFSDLYRDRPLTAQENVVFWTEYVLRHHGAPHMQSPLVHMNFIERNNLDLLVIVCITLYIFWRVLKACIKYSIRKLCSKPKIVEKKNSKKKAKKN